MATMRFDTTLGATGDGISIIATDANGAVVDLTGAAAPTFTMKALDGTVKVNAQPAEIVSPATSGLLRYAWGSNDLNAAGHYLASFQVTVSSKTVIYPGKHYIVVKVQAREGA